MSTVTHLHAANSLSARVAAEVRAQAGRHGLKQVDLAELLGLTPGQVSGRYRGRIPFTLRDLDILAKRFGIEPAAFMPTCAIRDSNPEPADSVSASIVNMAGWRRRVADRRKSNRGPGPRKIVLSS